MKEISKNGNVVPLYGNGGSGDNYGCAQQYKICTSFGRNVDESASHWIEAFFCCCRHLCGYESGLHAVVTTPRHSTPKSQPTCRQTVFIFCFFHSTSHFFHNSLQSFPATLLAFETDFFPHIFHVEIRPMAKLQSKDANMTLFIHKIEFLLKISMQTVISNRVRITDVLKRRTKRQMMADTGDTCMLCEVFNMFNGGFFSQASLCPTFTKHMTLVYLFWLHFSTYSRSQSHVISVFLTFPIVIPCTTGLSFLLFVLRSISYSDKNIILSILRLIGLNGMRNSFAGWFRTSCEFGGCVFGLHVLARTTSFALRAPQTSKPQTINKTNIWIMYGIRMSVTHEVSISRLSAISHFQLDWLRSYPVHTTNTAARWCAIRIQIWLNSRKAVQAHNDSSELNNNHPRCPITTCVWLGDLLPFNLIRDCVPKNII